MANNGATRVGAGGAAFSCTNDALTMRLLTLTGTLQRARGNSRIVWLPFEMAVEKIKAQTGV